MIADYRFLRTVNGATAFAKVSLVATPSADWALDLTEMQAETALIYRSAIEAGFRRAVAQQDRLKGNRFSVVVKGLVETASDTTADAVECAATIAAWKSFGGSESDVVVGFEAGQWKVSFA